MTLVDRIRASWMAALCLGLAGACLTAAAEDGVTNDEIVIGATRVVTGPIAVCGSSEVGDQNSQHTLRLADRLYVLANGRVVFEGTPAELRDTPDMLERYLGVHSSRAPADRLATGATSP